jgi:hypothetical protein
MTERGDALFEELLATRSSPSDDERSFNLRLAFARYLSPDARIGMLERRRAYLLERLARTTGAVRNGWERLDAYTRSLLEHGNETAERDISWLDRLIARERASAGRPAGDAPPSRHRGGPATGTGGGDAPTPANPGSHRSGRGPRRVRKPRDWAASTAPTMPARPAHTQGGMTNP